MSPIEGVDAPLPSSEAALKELLRGKSVYDTYLSGCAVKPYGSGPVSLPKGLSRSPQLHDCINPDDRQYLQGNHERMQTQESDTQFVAPNFDVAVASTTLGSSTSAWPYSCLLAIYFLHQAYSLKILLDDFIYLRNENHF